MEPPDLLDHDDTDEELMLNLYHSQTHALVKVNVSGLVPPMGLAASGCSPGHIVMPSLSHGVTSDEYASAPPCTCWHTVASLPVKACHNCEI